MEHISFFVYFIFISFLASLTLYLKPAHSYGYLKYFSPFLLTTIFVEVYGSYLRAKGKSNIEMYNIFLSVEVCFYIWIISQAVRNLKARQVLNVTIIIYILASTANMLFGQKAHKFNTLTYSLGCLLVVSACIYYFLETFRLPKGDKLYRIPGIWLCTGLLIYYCCGLPLFGLINYWATSPDFVFVIKNIDLIINSLNVFLYMLFTIAFLCIRIPKYSSSSS